MLTADITANIIIITITDTTIPAIAPVDSPSKEPIFVLRLSVVLVLVEVVLLIVVLLLVVLLIVTLGDINESK